MQQFWLHPTHTIAVVTLLGTFWVVREAHHPKCPCPNRLSGSYIQSGTKAKRLSPDIAEQPKSKI